MDSYSNQFIEALKNNDLEKIKSIPKSDLHNHGMLGSRFSNFLKWSGKTVQPAPKKMRDLEEMNNYLESSLSVLLSPPGFEYGIKSALLQAKNDGISTLEMSIDIWFLQYFKDAEAFTKSIDTIYMNTAPEIDFKPEIGFPREVKTSKMFPKVEECIETGYFKSIDLYGLELARDAKKYKPVYRKAKEKGMKLKCHAGEFGTAESVRYTIEELELDAVQHGIAAATSENVTKWLANNKISLNICPTSNVKLSRVDKIENHPIQKLYREGVNVTINSDDIMIFDSSVSEEYLKLYRANVLNAVELNHIRLNGLV